MAKSEFFSDEHLLERITWGTLCCIDAEEKPYAIPLHAIYCKEEHCFFFHCGLTGRKIDALELHPSVAYSAVIEETLMADTFTTHYTSVLIEGSAHRISDAAKARKALVYLTEALAPGSLEKDPGVLRRNEGTYLMYRIDINAISCKKHG